MAAAKIGFGPVAISAVVTTKVMIDAGVAQRAVPADRRPAPPLLPRHSTAASRGLRGHAHDGSRPSGLSTWHDEGMADSVVGRLVGGGLIYPRR